MRANRGIENVPDEAVSGSERILYVAVPSRALLRPPVAGQAGNAWFLSGLFLALTSERTDAKPGSYDQRPGTRPGHEKRTERETGTANRNVGPPFASDQRPDTHTQ